MLLRLKGFIGSLFSFLSDQIVAERSPGDNLLINASKGPASIQCQEFWTSCMSCQNHVCGALELLVLLSSKRSNLPIGRIQSFAL